MLMTSVTKVINVRLFLYGVASAGVNAPAAPVRVAGSGAHTPGRHLPGPLPAPHGPSCLRQPLPLVLPAQGRPACRAEGMAALAVPGPREARRGLAALQRSRQRHSLCRRCPPLFSPRARGDAPALLCLLESAAVPAQRSAAPLPAPGTPGLPPCLADVVLLPALWAAS